MITFFLYRTHVAYKDLLLCKINEKRGAPQVRRAPLRMKKVVITGSG